VSASRHVRTEWRRTGLCSLPMQGYRFATEMVTQHERIKGIVVKTDQGYFCLDPADKFVSNALVENGGYGFDELEFAKKYIRPNSSVLVVGAHIGAIAIPLSTVCEELVAVEANPATYELLQLNVRLNERKNLKTIYAAANDKDGTLN